MLLQAVVFGFYCVEQIEQ